LAGSQFTLRRSSDEGQGFFAASSGDGPVILWVRTGNAANRTLITQIMRAQPEILSAIERREAVIEFVGHY
jgi:predicted nuclease of predicted toxin-antitoxin system